MTGTLAGTGQREARLVRGAPRAEVYRLLAGALRYPQSGFPASLPSGAWQRSLASAVVALPYGGLEAPGPIEAGEDLESIQIEYTRLFDVGEHGPPCPLNEGHYSRDRLRVMEEVIRFFEFFGMRFAPESGLLPDHVSVELEFMGGLASGAVRTDPDSALRGQHDFLERHLCGWLPALDQAVSHYAELDIYPALTRLASGFCEADRSYLAALLRDQGTFS